MEIKIPIKIVVTTLNSPRHGYGTCIKGIPKFKYICFQQKLIMCEREELFIFFPLRVSLLEKISVIC